MLAFGCEANLGAACVHSIDCTEAGTACKAQGSLWIDGVHNEDKLGECVCDNYHTLTEGQCVKNTKQV